MTNFKLFLLNFHNQAVKQMTDEEIAELETMFNEYLNQRFKDKLDKLANINDISLGSVIQNAANPLRKNGYHPAYVLHFDNFIKEQYQKIQENATNK